jgi:excisionase family DNA binding protein
LNDDTITVNEAAEMLRVSPQSVRRWLKDGHLQGTKVGKGKLWRLSRSEVEKYLNSKEGSFDSADKGNG